MAEALTLIADDDGDNYVRQGVDDAEFFANGMPESNVVLLNRGFGREFIPGISQEIVRDLGYIGLRRSMPKFN
ncbi:MAG TPA: hypothetical protein VK983_03965 [Candidatus Limnocylindrales bacterium]|nr:hypothetical protein [Candidatus Limnocylindrales bacterium]